MGATEDAASAPRDRGPEAGGHLLKGHWSIQCASNARRPRCGTTTAGGATLRASYLISFWTSPALLAAGILIEPLMILAFAAVISPQTFAGMYFDFSSEMPPFVRLRS